LRLKGKMAATLVWGRKRKKEQTGSEVHSALALNFGFGRWQGKKEGKIRPQVQWLLTKERPEVE
jgi:hypothetical protein